MSAAPASLSASASGSPAKTAHYSSTLTAALLRGAWADGQAGKDAKGYDLSWGELVRKWSKHTGGNTVLIHHLRDISLLYLSAHSSSHPSASGYITVAAPSSSQTPPRTSTSTHPADGLHSSNSSAEAGSSQSGSSFIHIPHPHLRRSRSKPSLDVARSNVTASSSAGGSTLRPGEKAAFLSAADLDGDEVEGEEAWAEGSGWWNGVSVDQVDEVREGIRAFEGALTGGKLQGGDAQSARLLLAYHYNAIGDHEATLRELDAVDWKADPRLVGEAALLDRIRGRCLQGISTEIRHPSSPAALDSYLATIPLVTSLFPPPTPTYLPAPSVGKSTRIAFEPNREVHRWLSTALCRATIISSRQPNNAVQTLRILRTYHAYAASWPSSFRPNQRHRMLLLYLTALAASYPPSHTASESPYLLTAGSETFTTARAVWRKEVAVAIKEGQQLLAQTTRFPRAGSVNLPVIRFTNLCVILADRSTGLTAAVIDVLWWSMNLTFQSQSVLRHLTRLLLRNGHDLDAKRAFELYVQLVLKSRETAQPETSLHLDQPSSAPPPAATGAANQAGPSEHQLLEEADEAELETSQNPNAQMDSDRDFIGALLVGARVLSREMADLEEGWRYASLAKGVIEQAAAGQIGRKARAEVEEVLGIIRTAMANTASDPITRPTLQAEAINHLLAATKLYPSSAQILYHLSYAQAEARAVDDAIESIHASLEIDSEDVQAWHLLALLLTAKRDWEGARKACEAGVAIWEGDEANDVEEEEEDEVELGGSLVGASIESRDFAARATPPSRASPAAQSSNTSPLLLPSGAIQQLRPVAPAKSTRTRRLNNVIRLRMTWNVITEKTLGSEAAMLRQQELFAFFSARTGEGRKRFGLGGGTLGGLSGLPSVGSIGGLGGSFVSVPGTGGDFNVNVQAPTPGLTQGYTLDAPPHITHSSASSPGNSTPSGDASEDGDREEILSRDFAEKASIKDGKSRKSHGLGKKSLVKHLHVPGVKGMGKGRPSSVRRLQSPSEVDITTRNRTASMSTIALSIAPTAVHSHFHGAGPNAALRPPTAPPMSTADPSHGRTAAESRLLSNLWLMSAATFRRWGKPEQCLVAINEAELLDPENADVWIQLGLYHSTTSGSASSAPGSVDVQANTEMALSAFTKSILLRPLHPAGSTHLAKMYLAQGQVDLAHSFLNQVTQDSGWDVPEAWVLLARACKEQGRYARERECLIYALGLEETRPARGLRDAVDRWL